MSFSFSNFSVSTLIYIVVFTGCYIYFIWDLPFRFNRPLSILALALCMMLVYVRTAPSLQGLLIRYLHYLPAYAAWSLIFLKVRPRYALYLSVFITIFMGIWISCVQVILYALDIENRTILTLVTGLCRICSIVIIKRFFVKTDASRTISIHEMLISLLPAIACMIANAEVYDYLNFIAEYNTAQNTLLLHISVIFFGFSAMLILISSETYFQTIRYREENERAQNQLNAQYQLFLAEKENAERIRAFHHDLKNHLDTIETMINTGDARTYISNLREAEQETEMPFDTGCPTLDALLAAKQPVMQEKGIRLSCFAHFSKANALTPMELCTLFSNSLDNAIEAVSTLPEEKRTIHISGGEVNGNMVVRMENPYAHSLLKKGNLFTTTKANHEAHGYGLSNMLRIIEKHNGTMTYKTENGLFSLFFMVPVAQKNA